MDPNLIVVALISVIGTIIVAVIGSIPLLLPLLRQTKHIATQVTPNGGNTNTLGDRIVRTEAHAQHASRMAGEAAVRVDITAQELAEYRQVHESEARSRDQRLTGISAQLVGLKEVVEAGRLREQTYLASLNELGLDIRIPPPEQQIGDD